MLSLEDLSAVRIAIELCNNNELKQKVLCVPGSEYDNKKRRYHYDYERKAKWSKMLESKTKTVLENLGVVRVLLEKVTGLVIVIARKMLTWAKYHEGTLDLSLEYCGKFLNSSFFTSHGNIDNKRAAEELMKQSSLNIKQKYTLACLYCLTEHIHDLFTQLSQEDKENFSQKLYYPEIIKFWSDYLIGEIDKLRGEKSLDRYMLEKAIGSGSKAAVEYCLEETSLSRKKDAVTDAAMETIRKTPEMYYYFYDWQIFTPYHRAVQRIPINHFVDILCFLLSKMNEEQKVEFLKKDIEYSASAPHPYSSSRVLKCFLHWPYENYFMKTANLMWEFLPERMYADLLLEIHDIINPRIIPYIDEGERYDYKKLLNEFWIQSPDHYKRYVFNDKKTLHFIGEKEIYVNFIIVELFTLYNDTYEDWKIFELILDSATDEEKERIISAEEGKYICIRLMKGQKWEMLGILLSKCISSKEEIEEFKRRLSLTEEAQRVCANFIIYNWDAAEFLIKWSSLAEEEIILFKREMIYSHSGRRACWDLFLNKGGEIANRFCEWCFSSEEEIWKFKKELIFADGVKSFADLIIEDKLEVVDEFINWSHLSQEEIREFKKQIQYETGNYICENLITGDVNVRIEQEIWSMFNSTIQFQGGKWEQVEKFLTWCFPSEEEIIDFKKNRLLKISGKEIHFFLIESFQWEEAETFFAWLGLSLKKVKELKKEALFEDERVLKMLRLLLYGRTFGGELSNHDRRQENIELFLRWHLTDKETVLEFRDHFKQKCRNTKIPEKCEKYRAAIFRNFDLAIQQHLSDLDEEERGLYNVEIKKVE